MGTPQIPWDNLIKRGGCVRARPRKAVEEPNWPGLGTFTSPQGSTTDHFSNVRFWWVKQSCGWHLMTGRVQNSYWPVFISRQKKWIHCFLGIHRANGGSWQQLLSSLLQKRTSTWSFDATPCTPKSQCKHQECTPWRGLRGIEFHGKSSNDGPFAWRVSQQRTQIL